MTSVAVMIDCDISGGDGRLTSVAVMIHCDISGGDDRLSRQWR